MFSSRDAADCVRPALQGGNGSAIGINAAEPNLDSNRFFAARSQQRGTSQFRAIFFGAAVVPERLGDFRVDVGDITLGACCERHTHKCRQKPDSYHYLHLKATRIVDLRDRENLMRIPGVEYVGFASQRPSPEEVDNALPMAPLSGFVRRIRLQTRWRGRCIAALSASAEKSLSTVDLAPDGQDALWQI